MRHRFAILVVCTANICRSPLAELLLASRLDLRRFEVASAGVRGWQDQPMDAAVQEQARTLGLEPESFRSRALLPEHVAVADLVLTATREHRAGVLDLDPSALRRTFTLREFARLGPLVEAPDLEGLAHAAATRRGLAGVDVDVPDPYRGDETMHRRVAELIDEATETVADRLMR